MKFKFRYKQKKKDINQRCYRGRIIKIFNTNNTILNNYRDISWTSIWT